MFNFILPRDVPSKKNSKQIIHVKGRTLIISSKQHKEWHDRAMSYLFGENPVEGQISRVKLVFYPSTKRKFDLTNKAESIMDLLVDAGIIEDDNCYIIPEVILKFGGHDKINPRCEITIL